MVADVSKPNGEQIGAFAGFQAAREYVNNAAELEAQFPLTRAGASNWRQAETKIVQKRNPSHKFVRRIESRQHDTDRLKMQLERVGGIKVKSSRSIKVNNVLGIRELEPLSREEERQSPPMFEGEVIKNSVRQYLRRDEVLRKAFQMDPRSSPASIKAGLNSTAEGRLTSHASFGNRSLRK